MTDKSVEQKPSDTALFAALRRALSYMEYKGERYGPDSLAHIFLPAHFRFFLKFNKIRDNTQNKLAVFFPGMHEYIIARTAWFDKLFVEALNNRTPQIVLLGAGYDSRAYRFAGLNGSTRIFELDAAPTQNRKRKCLKAAHIDIPPQVKFLPLNFNREPLSGVLEKAGYQYGEKTLFIWEGVSYYLDRESVDSTLAFVSRSASDSLIAFDCTVSVAAENQDMYYGTKEFAQTMHEHHANEEIMFSLNEGEIESFLEQGELKLVEYLNAEEIERTYLLNEDGSSLGRIIGHFRFLTASPADK
ncbi:MAG: class I SAM-dependent methyltransferase [Dehalococcoidia bacterium]|nr:class I SAM-dependent methyltransferase [Dehalococcoidia bacterium]